MGIRLRANRFGTHVDGAPYGGDAFENDCSPNPTCGSWIDNGGGSGGRSGAPGRVGTSSLAATRSDKDRNDRNHPIEKTELQISQCLFEFKLPAYVMAFVLLIKPLLERRKIIEHGGGIHIRFARKRFERLRPRGALPISSILFNSAPAALLL